MIFVRKFTITTLQWWQVGWVTESHNGLVLRPLRSDILYDVGQSINPGIDLGQLEGAFVFGIMAILWFGCCWGSRVSNKRNNLVIWWNFRDSQNYDKFIRDKKTDDRNSVRSKLSYLYSNLNGQFMQIGSSVCQSHPKSPFGAEICRNNWLALRHWLLPLWGAIKRHPWHWTITRSLGLQATNGTRSANWVSWNSETARILQGTGT